MAVVLALPGAAAAQGGQAGAADVTVVIRQVTLEVMQAFRSAFPGLLLGFFGLEMAVTAKFWMGKKTPLDERLKEVAWKVIVLIGLYALGMNMHLWVDPILDGVKRAGVSYAGIRELQTGEIFETGVGLVERLPEVAPAPDFGLGESMRALGKLAWVLSNLDGIIAVALNAGVILVVFCVVAAQVLLGEVEARVLLMLAPLFISAGVFRVTAGASDKFIELVCRALLRLFLLFVMVAAGAKLLVVWVEAVGNSYELSACPGVAFAACTAPPVGETRIMVVAASYYPMLLSLVLWGYLSWKIPGFVASQVGSGIEPGLKKALRGEE